MQNKTQELVRITSGLVYARGQPHLAMRYNKIGGNLNNESNNNTKQAVVTNSQHSKQQELANNPQTVNFQVLPRPVEVVNYSTSEIRGRSLSVGGRCRQQFIYLNNPTQFVDVLDSPNNLRAAQHIALTDKIAYNLGTSHSRLLLLPLQAVVANILCGGNEAALKNVLGEAYSIQIERFYKVRSAIGQDLCNKIVLKLNAFGCANEKSGKALDYLYKLSVELNRNPYENMATHTHNLEELVDSMDI
jgi:hypothetical protein